MTRITARRPIASIQNFSRHRCNRYVVCVDDDVADSAPLHQLGQLDGAALVPYQATTALAFGQALPDRGNSRAEPDNLDLRARDRGRVVQALLSGLDDVDEHQPGRAGGAVVIAYRREVAQAESDVKTIAGRPRVAPAQRVQVDQRVHNVGAAENLGNLRGNAGFPDADWAGDDKRGDRRNFSSPDVYLDRLASPVNRD
jgi:hypothetical protein